MATNLDDRISEDYEKGHGTYKPKELKNAENESANHAETSMDGSAESGQDAGNTIREAENTPGGAWPTNVTGSGGGKKPLNVKQIGKSLLTKKGAALGGVSGVLGVVIILLSSLLSPGMLFVHIKEVLEDRFRIENTTLDVRSHKILTKKLSSAGTSGCAGPIKLTCKFSRMSNRMLKNMADKGMVPYKNGKPLDVSDKAGWKTQRPDEFRPTKASSISLGLKEGESVKASSFSRFVRDNPSAAGVFRKAFNPRWSTFWDSTRVRFLDKIGFGGRESKIKGDDEKSVKEDVDKKTKALSEGDVIGKAEEPNKDDDGEKKPNENDAETKANADSIDEGINAAKNGGGYDEISKKISKKAAGPMAFISVYCLLATDLPTIGRQLRKAQQAALMAYGIMMVAQIADEIKAGGAGNIKPASAAKVSVIGFMLAESIKDSSGNIQKRSAMESDGMLYGLEGNKAFNSKTSDINNWIPGGGLIRSINTLSSAVRGSNKQVGAIIDKICHGLSSPIGQVIQIAADPTKFGLLTAGAMQLIMSSPPFQKVMGNLFKSLAGSLIHNTDIAEDLGNAISNGLIYSLAEGGNEGATMPLTVNQALAYGKLTKEVQLANAKVDRASLSPFDAGNPNTFLGSIYTKFIPYYGMVQSGPIGAFGAATNIVSQTFSSLLTPKSSAYADLTAEDLQACPDTSITKTEGIAADYICNVQYGIPTNYLNGIEPDENVQWLYDQGYLTEDKSKSVAERDDTIVKDTPLDKYLDACAQGESTLTHACIIDNEMKARFALYYIDHRLQKNMDGEDVYKSDASGSSGNSPDSSAGGSDDVPAPWKARIGGQWLGMIPGQCSAFAAWRIAQQWYGSALKSDGSNLASLLSKHPIPGISNLAVGNGIAVAGNLISGGGGTKVDGLNQAQAGDIVSVRTGNPAGHVYVILSKEGNKITVEQYNIKPEAYSTATFTIGDGSMYDNVVAIARVKRGGGNK